MVEVTEADREAAAEAWDEACLADLYYTPVSSVDPAELPEGKLAKAFATHRIQATAGLAAERDHWFSKANERALTIDEMRRENDRLKWDAVDPPHVSSMAAENERLREALKPFAKLGEVARNAADRDPFIYLSGPVKGTDIVTVEIRLLDAARAALGGKTGETK